MKESSKGLKRILNKEIKYFLITLLSIITIAACSGIKKIDNNRLIVKIQNKYLLDSLEYGEIIYKSPAMDTLVLKEKDKRFLWFHFGIYNQPQDIKQLQGHTIESYKAINDSVIPFDSKHNKEGTYYLEGYIEETILLHNYYNTGDMRKISNLVKVSKKIIVVDK